MSPRTCAALAAASFIWIAGQTVPAPPDPVAAVFKARCLRCHSGPTPASGLSLEADKAAAQLVGRASREKPDLLLVVPGEPDRSYLLDKILGLPGIKGLRMPKGSHPLAATDTALISDWVKSLKPAER